MSVCPASVDSPVFTLYHPSQTLEPPVALVTDPQMDKTL